MSYNTTGGGGFEHPRSSARTSLESMVACIHVCYAQPWQTVWALTTLKEIIPKFPPATIASVVPNLLAVSLMLSGAGDRVLSSLATSNAIANWRQKEFVDHRNRRGQAAKRILRPMP